MSFFLLGWPSLSHLVDLVCACVIIHPPNNNTSRRSARSLPLTAAWNAEWVGGPRRQAVMKGENATSTAHGALAPHTTHPLLCCVWSSNQPCPTFTCFPSQLGAANEWLGGHGPSVVHITASPSPNLGTNVLRSPVAERPLSLPPSLLLAHSQAHRPLRCPQSTRRPPPSLCPNRSRGRTARKWRTRWER